MGGICSCCSEPVTHQTGLVSPPLRPPRQPPSTHFSEQQNQRGLSPPAQVETLLASKSLSTCTREERRLRQLIGSVVEEGYAKFDRNALVVSLTTAEANFIKNADALDIILALSAPRTSLAKPTPKVVEQELGAPARVIVGYTPPVATDRLVEFVVNTLANSELAAVVSSVNSCWLEVSYDRARVRGLTPTDSSRPRGHGCRRAIAVLVDFAAFASGTAAAQRYRKVEFFTRRYECEPVPLVGWGGWECSSGSGHSRSGSGSGHSSSGSCHGGDTSSGDGSGSGGGGSLSWANILSRVSSSGKCVVDVSSTSDSDNDSYSDSDSDSCSAHVSGGSSGSASDSSSHRSSECGSSGSRAGSGSDCARSGSARERRGSVFV